jgi:hypothetical protein
MKNKIGLILFCLALLRISAYAQDKFNAYTQKIEGTGLSYDMKAIPG